MRTLRRRLQRWRRYADKTWRRHTLARGLADFRVAPSGHRRAYDAVVAEMERRSLVTLYIPRPDDGPCDCPDCVGDYRCCNAGEEGHPGPCVTTCSGCGGGRRCPHCGGEDDLGCHECGGSGSCPDCGGQGEHVEEYYIGRPVETVQTGGLL